MKKIIALIAVLILGIASVSIVSSLDECMYDCSRTPPSECLECINNCHEGDPEYEERDGFLTCQIYWFTPYWMEIYSNEVKGCYARDLVCFNRLDQYSFCPEECDEICDNDRECFDDCCCYLYGQPTRYLYLRGDDKGPAAPGLTLTVPSCTDSRTFFSEPPPCTRSFPPPALGECCFDLRNCPPGTEEPSPECFCDGYDLPANYRCDVNEYVIMGIYPGSEGQILINGMLYESWMEMIVWYNGEKPFEPSNEVVMKQGVPRTITIEGEGYLEFWLEQKCCYDCTPKPSLPATILYPKVDIETFSVPGGATVISDGKVRSEFEMSPGSQQVFLQVENRGFFTQNDSRVRFDNLPEGVTVEVTPETQKITAHNLGTYSANFTVGPNVPSGTYQVTMIAYSPRGVFDKITFEFVVP